jgi:thiol-disulfide isomerase/thioredoxin
VLALALSQGWDRQFQSSVLSLFPNYATTLTSLENVAPVRAVLTQRVGGPAATLGGGSEAASVFAGLPEGSPAGVLGDFGQAPELVAAGPWFNGAIPDMGSLRGKVVLVDFWTYSCVNCLRTLPWLKAMYAKYRDAGFVIIGVHTPEFEFEKSSANVKTAIADLGVAWPVVQDNDYSQWKAYSNSYWPSHFLIDAKGAVRNVHYGEGAYAETEALIQKLLVSVPGATGLVAKSTDAVSTPAASAGPVNTASTVNAASSVNAASPAGSGANPLTPETYLGYARARGFVSTVDPVPDKPTRYAANPRPGEGRWSLGGTWTIRSEFIEAGGGGSLTLGFDASDVLLVIEPVSSGGSLEVWLDGKPAADTADVKGGLLRPDKSRLYHLVGNRERGSHLLELRVKGGERFFAFTFG